MASGKICRVCRATYPPDAKFCLNDATDLDVQDPTREGGIFGAVLGGKYRVLRRIGGGGMGEVYEAQHEKLGKHVAIKVLHAEFNRNSEAISRFQREAQIAASIGHPHIVDISDFDTTPDGSHFIVMELLDGEELRKVMQREKRLPVRRACAILAQVADALGAAHERGIIHRDLKPENVILVARHGSRDFAKVLDFGISKVRSDGANLTKAGMIVGTPYYMSPEQARGDADVDGRADVYSMGALLYEMLTGVVPFQASEIHGVLVKILTEEPQPPRAHVPDLPPAVEMVVVHAMAKDRRLRYPTCAAFAQELMASAGMSGQASFGAEAFLDTVSLPSPLPAGATHPSGGLRQPRPPTPAPLAARSATPPAAGRPQTPRPAGQRTTNPAASSAASWPSTPGPVAVTVRRPGTARKRLDLRRFAIVGGVGGLLLMLVLFSIYLSHSVERAVATARSDQLYVEFEAIPTLTTVYRGDKRLCDTPCQMEFSRGAPSFEVEFRHTGYLSQKRKVILDGEHRTIHVQLEALTIAPLRAIDAGAAKKPLRARRHSRR
ncbi:MAG: protein kinase [Myxococcota bacterium]